MKVSFNWLAELVELPAGLDVQTAADRLTLQGLEVEGIERVGAELAGVIVAEVTAIAPHPNADKLRIVSVRSGGRQADVVCGAPNVPPPGNRVCWAPPGATLPGGRTLDAREVRGVMSPGMLCSDVELGLAPADKGDKGDGILILAPDAPPGTELAAYLGLPDFVLEINVTPNRPDALSHVGIARELAAAFGTPLRRPPTPNVRRAEGAAPMDVTVADPVACPRYVARFVSELQVGPSPLPMRLRLQACGIRAISNLVDVTNYVLLETGHPLHAFDLDKLDGNIVVRRALAGERMQTLDGQDRALVPGDVVIADARGPVALAGVMGGATSEVSDGTRRVLLESATFDPVSVRRTSKRLGLTSEASYRFERGVDAAGVAHAAERAATLLAALGGGVVLEAAVDRQAAVPARRRVSLSMARLDRITGKAGHTPDATARQLERLGFEALPTASADGVDVVVPTFRPDVAIPEDLVEELLRISGAFGEPADAARLATNTSSLPNPEAPADRARDRLAAAGLHEIAGWGFVPRASLAALAPGADAPELTDALLVKNPISADYEAMRTSLLPGLAAALARNGSRGNVDLGLFEVGPVIRKRTGQPAAQPHEPTHAAALLSGSGPGWLKPAEPLDFFDAKAILQDLLAAFGVDEASFAGPSALGFLHPGVSADVRVEGTLLGSVGELHPVSARRLGLQGRAFYLEAHLDALPARRDGQRAEAPPRYPAVTRDVSFWIDAQIPAADLASAFREAREPLLRALQPLEDFRDPRYVPAGKKGMLWSLTYRADDRTLVDAEVDAAHGGVVAALRARHVIDVR